MRNDVFICVVGTVVATWCFCWGEPIATESSRGFKARVEGAWLEPSEVYVLQLGASKDEHEIGKGVLVISWNVPFVWGIMLGSILDYWTCRGEINWVLDQENWNNHNRGEHSESITVGKHFWGKSKVWKAVSSRQGKVQDSSSSSLGLCSSHTVKWEQETRGSLGPLCSENWVSRLRSCDVQFHRGDFMVPRFAREWLLDFDSRHGKAHPDPEGRQKKKRNQWCGCWGLRGADNSAKNSSSFWSHCLCVLSQFCQTRFY